MFYSAQTKGFYDRGIHGDNIPSDAVEITQEEHAALLDGQSKGMNIVADGGGHPILQMPPPATLDELRAQKSAEIKRQAGQAIISGIKHAALGSEHHYPTTASDQQNLSGLVLESVLPGSGGSYKFWCADAEGVWKRREHTKLQIQEVGLAISSHVKAQQEKYELKLAEIAAAKQEDLALIGW